jgi:hypothetical protein
MFSYCSKLRADVSVIANNAPKYGYQGLTNMHNMFLNAGTESGTVTGFDGDLLAKAPYITEESSPGWKSGTMIVSGATKEYAPVIIAFGSECRITDTYPLINGTTCYCWDSGKDFKLYTVGVKNPVLGTPLYTFRFLTTDTDPEMTLVANVEKFFYE